MNEVLNMAIGLTLREPPEDQPDILRKSSFIFTREGLSIDHPKKAGIEGSRIAFAYDATFFLNISDGYKAVKLMSDNKIFVSPQMAHEVSIMDELLVNPLPADIRSEVVKHGNWLHAEAASP
jgi:hypothetical protein